MDSKKSKEQYLNEGINYFQSHQFDEALFSCEQAIQLDPRFFLAFYGKALALYRLERYEKALASFEQVIKIEPNYSPAYNGKGDVLSKLDRPSEAILAYSRAIQVDKNNWRAYYGMAKAYCGIMQYESSIYYFEEAYSRSPKGKISEEIYNAMNKIKRVINLKRIEKWPADLQRDMLEGYKILSEYYGEDIPEDVWEAMEKDTAIEAAPIGYSRIWDEDQVEYSYYVREEQEEEENETWDDD